MFASPNYSSNPSANFFRITPLSSTKMKGFPCRASAAAVGPKGNDLYKLLSVSGGCNASGEEIKRAYRAMALQYHPDLVCDPLLKEQSTRMFVQLNAAYKTLSDPVLRRQYDASVMGCHGGGHPHGRGGFELDRTVWERQILELKRRSARRRDRYRSVSASALGSWGERMQAQNCQRCEL